MPKPSRLTPLALADEARRAQVDAGQPVPGVIVALLDARKALDMFRKLKTPVLGLVENMSSYICPNCGHEAHIFGHGGVAAEAAKLGAALFTCAVRGNQSA
mgnify:CR=1 FL=1